MSKSYERIYAVVRQIPRGKVATYGQVARLAGLAGHARQVGYALHALTGGEDVPWHRVINSLGTISFSPDRDNHDSLQRRLLEDEGVFFNREGKVNLRKYLWHP